MQDVHEAVQDCVSLLRVPRSCLNICCSSRGAVSGLLSIQEHEDGPWIDCRASGYKALPGDCNAILDYCFQTTAQYILVVEKDVSGALQSLCTWCWCLVLMPCSCIQRCLVLAYERGKAVITCKTHWVALQAIFQRLVEDSFCELAPSIIVTAKGMPDLSTRVFLRQLHAAFPQLPVLGLVDWNPSGGVLTDTPSAAVVSCQKMRQPMHLQAESKHTCLYMTSSMARVPHRYQQL